MSVSWQFERELDVFSIGAKNYYTMWHQQDPTMTLSQMLEIVAKEREEAEREEWERYMADEAYYQEEQHRLIEEEAARLKAEEGRSLETIEESEEESEEEKEEDEERDG